MNRKCHIFTEKTASELKNKAEMVNSRDKFGALYVYILRVLLGVYGKNSVNSRDSYITKI